MEQNDLPRKTKDLLYALEHELLDTVTGQAVLRVLEAGIDDSFSWDFVQNLARKHHISQAFRGPYHLPHGFHGEIFLGWDLRGARVFLPLQYLNAHTLVIGNTGAGKTTRSRVLLMQVALHVPSLWAFDLRKREFRILRPYLAGWGIDLIVAPARRLKLNPLQVPAGVHPADWAPHAADLLVRSLSLPGRATKLLHGKVVRLYRAHGVIDGNQNFPTLFHLRDAIAADRGANVPAKQALIDSLDPVLLSLGHQVLGYHVGWDPEKLARRHLVFEFGGIGEAEKDLLLNSLMMPLFVGRIARGISNPKLDLFVLCDEAQRICGASRATGGVADLIGIMRGTGVGLDLSVLSANDLAPQVLSNTATKFLGRCGSATDQVAIGAAMGLTGDQLRWASQHLRPGMWIVQVGEGDNRHPFVLQTPRHWRLGPGGGTEPPDAPDDGGVASGDQSPKLLPPPDSPSDSALE